MIQEELAKKDMENPMNLRNVEISHLKRVVGDVNEVIRIFDTQNISETNKLFVAAANVVAKRLGKPATKRSDEPWWKRRIKQKIMQLRKDISRLERLVNGQLRRAEISEPLERKYNIRQKGQQIVLEEIKQRVTIQAAKLRRHRSGISLNVRTGPTGHETLFNQ